MSVARSAAAIRCGSSIPDIFRSFAMTAVMLAGLKSPENLPCNNGTVKNAPESKPCAGRGCTNVINRTNAQTGEVYSDARWKALKYCCAGCFNGRTWMEQEEAKKKALKGTRGLQANLGNNS